MKTTLLFAMLIFQLGLLAAVEPQKQENLLVAGTYYLVTVRPPNGPDKNPYTSVSEVEISSKNGTYYMDDKEIRVYNHGVLISSGYGSDKTDLGTWIYSGQAPLQPEGPSTRFDGRYTNARGWGYEPTSGTFALILKNAKK
jgi:hypothetical protein